MSRASKIVIGTAALLLASTLFLPRGDGPEGPDGALAPAGDRAETQAAAGGQVGRGVVTTPMRREIEDVVARGLSAGLMPPRASVDELARTLVRCVDLEGLRYCLHAGWTDRTVREVRDRVASAARSAQARPTSRESTGDLDTAALIRRAAQLTPEARARAERRELTAAARSVAKVWMLRHDILGERLPSGFLHDHPEARMTTAAGTTTARTLNRDGYPRRAVVMGGENVREQARTYWCGPATMQMIARAWQGEFRGQKYWAGRLNTTTRGSSIWDMVRVVNRATGYDRENRAGPYVVLDISGWNYSKWFLLNKRHIVDYHAPLVLHPVLLRRYYPYLDDDASGHFQVGRGYDKRGDKPAHIGYFEPWNQQRFDPSEPYIARVQWRSAYKSFRANKAHHQQNIGV